MEKVGALAKKKKSVLLIFFFFFFFFLSQTSANKYIANIHFVEVVI